MKYLLLSLLCLTFSCTITEKTDQELLEKDKVNLNKDLDSYKVSTYKFGKILIRASAEKETISPEFQSFKSDLDRIFNVVMSHDLEKTEDLSLLDYISIYRDYKKMEDFINKTDEDIFPTLVDAFNVTYGDSSIKNHSYYKGEQKEFVQNVEHSVLSAIVILSKDLGKEVSLYECSKTKPDLLPDSEIKTLLQYFRGFLFFEKGYFYLSEDEISRNINWLNNNKNVDLALTRSFFEWGNLDNQKTHTAFRSLNYLFRGFDRTMMEREIDEKRALEDFHLFLQDANEIGLYNEITWSIEAYLNIKNEDPEKAIAALNNLKSSPLLSDGEKKVIDQSISYLSERKSDDRLNGIYDKYFLSKIAIKYMFSILSKVDWEKVMAQNKVPHSKEIMNTIEKFVHFNENLKKYAISDQIKKAEEDIRSKGESIWEKATEVVQ